MARENRWDEMPLLIDNELIETIAVVGEPHEIAPRIRARLDGISDQANPDKNDWYQQLGISLMYKL